MLDGATFGERCRKHCERFVYDRRGRLRLDFRQRGNRVASQCVEERCRHKGRAANLDIQALQPVRGAAQAIELRERLPTVSPRFCAAVNGSGEPHARP